MSGPSCRRQPASRPHGSWAPAYAGATIYLLPLLLLDHLGVDDVLFLPLARGLVSVAAALRSAALGLLGLVHRLAELLRDLEHFVFRLIDPVGVVALERVLELGQGPVDRPALLLRNLVAVLAQRLLGH